MSLKQKTVSNVKWSFVESMSLKAMGFVLGIILARLLTPADFGLLAVVNVFYLLVTIFIDGGLKEALIQKNDATDIHYSTVFWLNLFMGSFLYFLLFISAPLIQKYYEYENLSFYIRLQAITLIIESFGIVQIAKATKELNLKKITKARIPASLLSFAVGIFMAYHGYGILSLIVQQLVNTTLYVFFLMIFVRYKPQFVFNFQEVRPLISFGGKILGMSLLSRFYVQGLNLIYAKFYSPQLLGLNSKANSIQQTPIEIINSTFMKGIYPTMVTLQSNIERLREIFLLNIKILTYVMLFINGIIFFKSHIIINLLLGDKWLESVIYLKILAVGSIVFPISVQVQNVFKIRKLLDIFLKIELFYKLFSLGFVFLFISKMSFPLMLSIVIGINFFFAMIYLFIASKELQFSFLDKTLTLIGNVLVIGLVGFAIDKLLVNFIIFQNNLVNILSFSFLFFILILVYMTIFDRKLIIKMSSKRF